MIAARASTKTNHQNPNPMIQMKSPVNLRSALVPMLFAIASQVPAQSNWTQLVQVNPPSPRSSPWMMTYDSANDRLVLFGGDAGTGNPYLGDTRLFDFATSTWSGIPAGPAPSARAYHSVTYDSARNEVILFGGEIGASGGALNAETWRFAGNAWTLVGPSQAPSARRGHSAVFDSTRNRIVLFGGETNAGDQHDTWEWDGTNWSLVSTVFPAPNRRQAAIAFDPIRGVTVLFGGRAGANTFYNGTFEWDGSNWLDVTPMVRPQSRAGASMCYYPELDRTVLHAGTVPGNQANDTWFWDGNTATWSQQFPGTPPPIAAGAAMVYHQPGKRLIRFGGGANGVPQQGLYAYAPVHLAALTPFGSGCPGNPASPTIAPKDHKLPWIGDTYGVRFGGLPNTGVCALVTGLSNQTWGSLPLPLPLAVLGIPGCSALVSVDVMDAKVHLGTASVDINVPNVPSAAGLSFFHQGLVFYNAVNPFGALVSDGLEAVLGLR